MLCESPAPRHKLRKRVRVIRNWIVSGLKLRVFSPDWKMFFLYVLFQLSEHTNIYRDMEGKRYIVRVHCPMGSSPLKAQTGERDK